MFYVTGERNFATAIARVRSLRPPPDVLFFSALPSEAGRLVRQFRAAGVRQPILSGDGFDTPLVGRVAGALADDVYYSTHVALDSRAPRVRRFVAAYRRRYGRRPENAFAALGYDTMRLLADAVRRARSTEPGAIRDALAATRGFAMVTGTISYAPTADPEETGDDHPDSRRPPRVLPDGRFRLNCAARYSSRRPRSSQSRAAPALEALLSSSISRTVIVIAAGLMLPLAFAYGRSRNRTTSMPATTIVVTPPIISACTKAGSAGSA
jgi:hypothetical protein